MCCQLLVVLLGYLAILYGCKGEVSTTHCPCTWNANISAADCSDKSLTKVPGTDCVPVTTRILDLSYNNITYQPGQFQTFTELIQLDLSVNKYFVPGNDSFSGLERLRGLKLDRTDLRNFRQSLFTEASNLKTLSLGFTGVGYLTTELFDNLQQLESLMVKYADITDTSNSPFRALHTLRDLSLSGNSGIMLTKQSFIGLTNLLKLDLSRCNFSDLSQDVFDELVSLSELDLHWNHMREIRDNQFASLQRLRSLDLSYSPGYMRFHPFTFAGLSELVDLNLDRTTIAKNTTFPNDVFAPLHQLEELYLI